jgi:predicted flap endonuclease-1-like 5' DNA nuclease
MRLDYVSYAVAIVFFIVTLAAAVYSSEQQQQVWVVTTVVIGIAFIGLGYTQRPRPVVAPPVTTSVLPPPPSQPQRQQEQQQQAPEVTTAPSQPIVTNVVKLEEAKPAVQPLQSPIGRLTDVKGIGEKRAAQIRALGITSVEDLAKASAKDLAAKLNISPKITDKWIESAKEIGQKP